MPSYQLYLFDERGRIKEAVSFDIASDAEARSFAEREVGRGAKELWSGAQVIAQYPPPAPSDYAAMISRVMEGLPDIQFAFEPGRMIAANAGVLVARVLHVNARPEGRRFLVLDAAMNDLLRPAMYDAYHEIQPVKPRDGEPVVYDVVGPICETGDTFTRDRALPPIEGGDLVAFMTAGAYGATMSSEYNSRLLAPEVLVKGSDFAVVRPRPTYEDMLAREQSAPWL